MNKWDARISIVQRSELRRHVKAIQFTGYHDLCIHALSTSPSAQAIRMGKLSNRAGIIPPVLPAIALAKIAAPPFPTFNAKASGLFRLKESFSQTKDKMLEDDRVKSVLRAIRINARRAWFNTARNLSVVPRKLQTVRTSARRGTTAAVRKANIQVSDDYIKGMLDFLSLAALVTLSAQAVRLSTRRYKTAADIPIRLIRRQGVLHGSVVAVRDGDNLRVRHTPALHRLLGLYMKPRGRGISADTINVRLAAVDAPECGKFGAKGQEYGPAAREWLKRYIGRRVMLRLHSTDQYRRVVATVWAKSEIPIVGSWGFLRRNVGLELMKAGYATVYTSSGAAYGGMRHVYEKAEALAKKQRIGMWARGKVETPAEYKRALRTGSLPKVAPSKSKRENASKETGSKALLKAIGDIYNYLTRFR